MIKIEYKLKIKGKLLNDPKIGSNIHNATTLIEVIWSADGSDILKSYYVGIC